MTRETKIGLLVGLAFLLVVGILLSDHITGTSERPAAPLADAGRTVRSGVSAPGAATDEPRPVEPQQPVPTAAELTPKQPITQVTINVPGGTPPQVIDHNGVPAAPPVGPSTVIIPAPQPTVVVHAPTDPFANPLNNSPLGKLARDNGEPLVPVDAPVTPVDPIKPISTAAREYKAQAGDTLSRLASQLPGGNVKANRDAIVALNPTLQKDPNRVVSGRSYLLPTVAARPADTGAVVIVKTMETKKTTETKTITPKPDAKTEVAKADDATTTRVYVVKAGDTLSKIASNELGTKNELPTIRKLNADVLKGSDVIKVDMKLKLPAKVMASVR